MVHKTKSKLTDAQVQALQDINEMSDNIEDLGDSELTLQENGLYSEADEALAKENELRKEKEKLIKKSFGTYRKYSNAQVKYGRKFS